MLKHKIENLRVVIQELMDSYENIKRCNQIKQNENDALTLEVEQMMRHITILQDQNRELDSELEKFAQSDMEIRSKLMDRQRSPLKLNDLYDGPNEASTPMLFNLQNCAMGSSREGTGRKTSPLRLNNPESEVRAKMPDKDPKPQRSSPYRAAFTDNGRESSIELKPARTSSYTTTFA